MTYRIVWEHNGQIYTEYGDLGKLTTILKFLEDHLGDFKLIEVTEYEG